MGFYEVVSIKLEDYDGNKQVCPINLILPLFRRTESKPVRLIEDKWLKICNGIYQKSFTKIKIIIKYL